MTDNNEAAAQPEQPQGGQLGIQKIYVKDLSFESPNAPQIFRGEWQPHVDVQLSNKAQKLEDDVYEVTLTVTVTVKHEEQTSYLIEVQQAGVFTITGFQEQHTTAMMATVCPNILFPFAREAISDVATRGGFPQLLLAPVNFEAMYAQELQRQQTAAPGADGTEGAEVTAH